MDYQNDFDTDDFEDIEFTLRFRETAPESAKKLVDKLIGIKERMCLTQYHRCSGCEDAAKTLRRIKKDLYANLTNIVFSFWAEPDEKSSRADHVWEDMLDLADAVNKLDDAIGRFVFVWETRDEDRFDGWQYPRKLTMELRDIFNVIEDHALFIKSRLDRTRVGSTAIIAKYPAAHVYDVVGCTIHGDVRVLHKTANIEDAQALIDVYLSRNSSIGLAIRDAAVYNPDINATVPKRQSHPLAFKKKLHKWQSGQCACCKDKTPLKAMHLDHITPLSAGGMDKECNLQLLCQGCNLTKNRKPIHNADLYEIVMKKRLAANQRGKSA